MKFQNISPYQTVFSYSNKWLIQKFYSNLIRWIASFSSCLLVTIFISYLAITAIVIKKKFNIASKKLYLFIFLI